MRSINARQLLAVGLSLIAFLGLTGIALDAAFGSTASAQMHERLKAYVFQIAKGAEILRSGDLYVYENYAAIDPRFGQPGSGLYAEVIAEHSHWLSTSAIGPELPANRLLAPADEIFDGPLDMQRLDGSDGLVYRYGIGFISAEGMGPDEIDVLYTIYVMEDAQMVLQQVDTFRSALWGNLGLSGIILLLLQWLILHWSHAPLRRVVAELKAVQRGQAAYMSGYYPSELEPLTRSINALIDSERKHLERQRNTMSDLAHSLKTPLAVLHARIDSQTDDAGLREEVATQCQRMAELVSYQLGRAASSGHKLFAIPLEIEPHAELIVKGLEKIHAAKGTVCEFDIDPAARFHGELGDLQELIGNLLENAFKWARSRVLFTVRIGDEAPERRPGLHLMVEDDGPGIPAESIARVLQRGVRGDERVQGHGIGLSIVQDIVRAYQGRIEVGQSAELGGARFEVSLPPGL